MPATLSPFIPGTGNPDTAYELVSTTPGANSPYAPGELGQTYESSNGITYRKVQVEASPQTVAAGQLAFWKDKANKIVTNVAANALLNGVASSNRNNVAGVFRGVVPANAQCFIAIRGRVAVLEAGAGAGGMTLIANSGTNADGLGVAVGGTATPFEQLGFIVTNFAGGKVTADINIPL